MAQDTGLKSSQVGYCKIHRENWQCTPTMQRPDRVPTTRHVPADLLGCSCTSWYKQVAVSPSSTQTRQQKLWRCVKLPSLAPQRNQPADVRATQDTFLFRRPWSEECQLAQLRLTCAPRPDAQSTKLATCTANLAQGGPLDAASTHFRPIPVRMRWKWIPGSSKTTPGPCWTDSETYQDTTQQQSYENLRQGM